MKRQKLDMSLNDLCGTLASYRRLNAWTTAKGKFTEARRPGFDDSEWEICNRGFAWPKHEGERWFRREIVIPETIQGIPVAGSQLDVRIFLLASGAELYVNGKRVDRGEYWFDSLFLLTEKARPGERYILAVHTPKTEGWACFALAEWYFKSVEDILFEIGLVDSRAFLLSELSALGWYDPEDPAVRAARDGLELTQEEFSDPGLLRDLVADFDEQIKPMTGHLSHLTSYLVGHAHIDMNWQWSWEDTIDTCRRTFLSVDQLMSEFPELRFSQSQAAIYRAMEENEPEVFRRICDRVREGRWEVLASTWVEGDLNMASGESLVRQTTIAMNYVETKLGVTPRVCWCPDTFGHPWTYPQILKKCGLDYYYGHRCARNEKEHLFWWEAPDGSRVLVFDEGVTYNNTVTPHLTKSLPKMIKHFDLPAHLVVFGVGDHGGGPTRRDLLRRILTNRDRNFPRFCHARAEEFFQAVENSSKIPVVADELNFVFEGCYTTHSDAKWMNRRGECQLYEAEVLSSLASVKGMEYPAEQLGEAWRGVLFNQFHDLLDGSTYAPGYEMSRRLYTESSRICSEVSENALATVTGLRDQDAERFTFFNTLGWDRTETVSVETPTRIKRHRVVEESTGEPIPSQIFGDKLLFTARVSSVGHASYRIEGDAEGKSFSEDRDAPCATPASERGRLVKIEGAEAKRQHLLENRFFRLEIDPDSGAITSFFDKRLGRELVRKSAPINLLQICYERPGKQSTWNMSSWKIAPIIRTDNLLKGARTQLVCDGPVQATIRVVRKIRKSHLRQDIIIHRDVPRIDFVTDVDWKETGSPGVPLPMLKVAFPWTHSSGTCVREIPFGHISSPTIGHEIPSLTFLELPGDGFGVALLNDCKYGHDVTGNIVRLTLLRTAYDPDPRPDAGRHRFTYSIYPHRGDWREAEVWKRGHELNVPLMKLPGRSDIPSRSWLSIDEPGIDLAALKMADDRNGLVIRMVEMHGRSVRFGLCLDWGAQNLQKCDLRERPVEEKTDEIVDGRTSLELSPYEISSWRVT